MRTLTITTLTITAALGGLAGRAAAQPNPTFAPASKDDAAAAAAVDDTDWEATAQAGLILTTGNSRVTTFSAGAAATRKANRNKVTLEGGVAYARADVLLLADADGSGFVEDDELDRTAITATESWALKGRYDRFLTDHDALYASAGAMADKPAGKDLVGNGQVGYSRQLYADDHHTVVGEAGYDFAYEDLAVGDGVAIHSARAFAGYEGKLRTETALTGSVEGLFNVNTLDTAAGEVGAFEDTRITSKLALTTKVSTKLSFRFGFEARYDHAPAPLPPGGVPFAAGFVPLADTLDTKAEAALIVTLL